jgi:hypothetical protein
MILHIQICALVICLFICGICTTAFADGAANQVREGKSIHQKILRHYPKLDKATMKPFIWGAGTENPRSFIYVPLQDWRKLSAKQKKALGKYAQSLVQVVMKDPLSYSGISPDALAAPRINQNLGKMTASSWGIYGGNISENGRDISLEKIVASGK